MNNNNAKKSISLELTFKELQFLGHIMQTVQINGSDAAFIANFIEKLHSKFNEVKDDYIEETTATN